MPPRFDAFVLVADDGSELARGHPTGRLPPRDHRQDNYMLVEGSKYAAAAAAAFYQA